MDGSRGPALLESRKTFQPCPPEQIEKYRFNIVIQMMSGCNAIIPVLIDLRVLNHVYRSSRAAICMETPMLTAVCLRFKFPYKKGQFSIGRLFFTNIHLHRIPHPVT
jgi:hypothetical protein